jgi:hypothetical protein
MWACIFGAVDTVIAGKHWPVWAGALALSLISLIVEKNWQQIKPTLCPRIASTVERIANRRVYRRVIYVVIVIALLTSVGIHIHHDYFGNVTQPPEVVVTPKQNHPPESPAEVYRKNPVTPPSTPPRTRLNADPSATAITIRVPACHDLPLIACVKTSVPDAQTPGRLECRT